ncbi:GyrI-like domain-containing protein [Parasediminibacterium sp. JCM 36343]|uniref:GyrI-like domain-containing protein n=1 Tax=Parasediminibacterium sp. JCM 36343 TaxID=3374279 RepID=UPI00397E2488
MRICLISIFLCFLFSCDAIMNSNTKDEPTVNTQPPPLPEEIKVDTPVINVEPTQLRPQLFMVMKDYANFEADAKEKQKVIFNNLDFVLKKNNLMPVGEPAAWHWRQPNLYFVEVGVPMLKKLPYNEPGVYYKQTKRCKAVVAHYFGPYSKLSQAYVALDEWLKDNKQKQKGVAWEVFMSDPKVMKDKTFLQTDVYCEVE